MNIFKTVNVTPKPQKKHSNYKNTNSVPRMYTTWLPHWHWALVLFSIIAIWNCVCWHALIVPATHKDHLSPEIEGHFEQCSEILSQKAKKKPFSKKTQQPRLSQIWWHRPEIPALGRWRQEDQPWLLEDLSDQSKKDPEQVVFIVVFEVE